MFTPVMMMPKVIHTVLKVMMAVVVMMRMMMMMMFCSHTDGE